VVAAFAFGGTIAGVGAAAGVGAGAGVGVGETGWSSACASVAHVTIAATATASGASRRIAHAYHDRRSVDDCARLLRGRAHRAADAVRLTVPVGVAHLIGLAASAPARGGSRRAWPRLADAPRAVDTSHAARARRRAALLRRPVAAAVVVAAAEVRAVEEI